MRSCEYISPVRFSLTSGIEPDCAEHSVSVSDRNLSNIYPSQNFVQGYGKPLEIYGPLIDPQSAEEHPEGVMMDLCYVPAPRDPVASMCRVGSAPQVISSRLRRTQHDDTS